MSRERISAAIVELEQLAAKALVVRNCFTFIDQPTFETMRSKCVVLRRLLSEEDDRFGNIIEQVGRVQDVTRAGGARGANPYQIRHYLDTALTRLRSVWRQADKGPPKGRDEAAST